MITKQALLEISSFRHRSAFNIDTLTAPDLPTNVGAAFESVVSEQEQRTNGDDKVLNHAPDLSSGISTE